MKKPDGLRNSIHPLATFLSLSALIGAMIAFPAAAIGEAQQVGEHQHQHAMSQAQGAAEPDTMMAGCKAMMAEREQMMKEHQAMDVRLDELLGAARSASGEAKVEALEAALEELVAQRRAMQPKMMKHHAAMMAHMMEQMGKGDMEMCPMMKGMMPGDDPEGNEDEHSQHHPG